MEIWKSVAGYEGAYEVSSAGRVRSVDRSVAGKGDALRNIGGRILLPAPNRHGYLSVSLWGNNIGKTLAVHKLVAMAFCQAKNGSTHVNHIDSCRSNNHSTNLEWVTRSENMSHASRYGMLRASANPKRANKLTLEDVRKIRELRSQGASYVFIGRKFSVSRETARQICSGGSWQ